MMHFTATHYIYSISMASMKSKGTGMSQVMWYRYALDTGKSRSIPYVQCYRDTVPVRDINLKYETNTLFNDYTLCR